MNRISVWFIPSPLPLSLSLPPTHSAVFRSPHKYMCISFVLPISVLFGFGLTMPQTLLDEFVLSLLLLLRSLWFLPCSMPISVRHTQATWTRSQPAPTCNAKIAAIQAQLVEIRVFRAHQTAANPPTTPTYTHFHKEYERSATAAQQKKRYPQVTPEIGCGLCPVHRMRNAKGKWKSVFGKLRLGKN